MVAPNIDAVFNFEEELEAGIQSYLEDNNLSPLISRDKQTDQDFNVYASVQIGGSIGDRKFQRPGGDHEFHFYEFTLNVRLKTYRVLEGESYIEGISKHHAGLRAKLRRLFAHNVSGTLNAKFNYLKIVRLVPAGSPITVDDGFDITDLQYEAQFMILEDAWPS
jgi:hypothetical protein